MNIKLPSRQQIRAGLIPFHGFLCELIHTPSANLSTDTYLLIETPSDRPFWLVGMAVHVETSAVVGSRYPEWFINEPNAFVARVSNPNAISASLERDCLWGDGVSELSLNQGLASMPFGPLACTENCELRYRLQRWEAGDGSTLIHAKLLIPAVE